MRRIIEIIGLQANCLRPHWSDSGPKLLQRFISAGYKNISYFIFHLHGFEFISLGPNYNPSNTKYSNNQGRHFKIFRGQTISPRNASDFLVSFCSAAQPTATQLETFSKFRGGEFIPNISQNPKIITNTSLILLKPSILTVSSQKNLFSIIKGGKCPPCPPMSTSLLQAITQISEMLFWGSSGGQSPMIFKELRFLGKCLT